MARPRPLAPRRVPAPGAPVPDLHPDYKIDPRPHLKFARMLARVVRRRAGFSAGSQEERELESVAYLTLCKQATRFDRTRTRAGRTADQQFQVWSWRNILTECEREAERLRQGGMTGRVSIDELNARREGKAFAVHRDRPPTAVGGLPAPRCANCADVTGGAFVRASGDAALARDLRRADSEVMDGDGEEVIRLAQPDAVAEALLVAAKQE